MPPSLDEVFDRYPAALSVEQCAELLGISRQSVYRRLNRPKNDPLHIPGGYRPGGGPWVIYKAFLRPYVESGAADADDPLAPEEGPGPEEG